MDRIKFIIASAERSAIIKHIEQFNIVMCEPMTARISKLACERNCARAYLTKRDMKEKSERSGWKARPMFACLTCKKYIKPSSIRMAEVIVDNRFHFGKRSNRNEKRGNMAGTSSVPGAFPELYNNSIKISSSCNEKSAADEADHVKHNEDTESDDIFDVGILVEIDEIQ